MAYRICKSFEIENGHMLSKHPDLCKFPHGHTRKVEFILEAEALDGNEMVCDFKVLKYTSPAGSFAANKLGLHDMGGNVWEWSESKWNTNTTRRVLRGASWLNYYPDYLLSSYRDARAPGNRYGDVGFRCVLVGGSGG